MPIIRIKDDSNCFDSMVRLHQSGYGKSQFSVVDGRIEYGGNTYVKVEDTDLFERYEPDDKSELLMTKEGAAWFYNLRGDKDTDKNKTGIAKWDELIASVRANFHDENSWLKYNTSEEPVNDSTKQYDIKMIKELVCGLWKNLNKNLVDVDFQQSAGEEDEITNVYGASIKLGLSASEAREPTPIVGRIYFTREINGNLRPISKHTAELLTKRMSAFKEGEGDGVDNVDANELKDKLVYGIQRCFKQPDSNNVSKYLYIPTPSDPMVIDDNKTIERMVELEPDAVEVLLCRSVEMLYTFQVKTRNRVYDVNYGSQAILRAVVDMNGEVTLKCLVCEDRKPLINRNIVLVEKPKASDDEKTEYYECYLDLEQTGFGLSEAQAELVSDYLQNHIILINCREAECSRIRCREGIISGEELTGINTRVNYCADCDRCEVIYNVDGVPRLTRTLVYDHERKDLVDKNLEESYTCKVCGRRYFSLNERKDICSFCQGGDDEESVKRAKQLFLVYARALSPIVRLKNTFASKKRCYEDEEFIVFNLNNSYYAIDKLNVLARGTGLQKTAAFKYSTRTASEKPKAKKQK